MFSQAGGVTDLSANEAQCWAVMEKTHVGPTGGFTFHGPIQADTSRAQLSPFGIFVMVKTVVVLKGFRLRWG